MTDADNPKRPNANYKLSKPDSNNNSGEEELVFYYNREQRLAKAPAAVRELYTAQKKKTSRFNLVAPLVADKPRAMFFLTIIAAIILIYAISFLGKFGKSYSLDGNTINLNGIRYEGSSIIVLRKTIKNRTNSYSGVVDIAVSPVAASIDDGFNIFYHRIFFTLESEEEYHFAVPFDSPELLVVLQTEKTNLNLKLNID